MRSIAGMDAVTIRDVPMPSPAPGEALVRLKAATPNFRDLLAVDGLVPGLEEPAYRSGKLQTNPLVASGFHPAHIWEISTKKPGRRHG